MSKNVSDQLVETLVEAGIQRIYAVTGDSLNHVNAAVHRNGKIKWIHVRNEETAAFAAVLDQLQPFLFQPLRVAAIVVVLQVFGKVLRVHSLIPHGVQ